MKRRVLSVSIPRNSRPIADKPEFGAKFTLEHESESTLSGDCCTDTGSIHSASHWRTQSMSTAFATYQEKSAVRIPIAPRHRVPHTERRKASRRTWRESSRPAPARGRARERERRELRPGTRRAVVSQREGPQQPGAVDICEPCSERGRPPTSVTSYVPVMGEWQRAAAGILA